MSSLFLQECGGKGGEPSLLLRESEINNDDDMVSHSIFVVFGERGEEE